MTALVFSHIASMAALSMRPGSPACATRGTQSFSISGDASGFAIASLQERRIGFGARVG